MPAYFPENEPVFSHKSPLEAIPTSDPTKQRDESEIELSPSPVDRTQRSPRGVDACDVVIVRHLASNNPELAFDTHSTDCLGQPCSTSTYMDTTLLKDDAGVRLIGPSIVPDSKALGEDGDDPGHALNADLLRHHAQAAVAVTEATAGPRPAMKDLASRIRVDSAQDGIPQLPSETSESRQTASALKLHTQPASHSSLGEGDTMATSPTLRKHVIPPAEDHANTLSALQPTSPTQDVKEPLPSIRQLTGPLSELAEAAATKEAQQPPSQQHAHHHSHSFSSTTSQSPRMPYFAQPSPNSHYSHSARSPTSTIGESSHYQSPGQYPMPAGYYTNRRSSAATEHTMSMPPSLPSASSSAESYGHASSSTDGYSTAHTTPIDQSTGPDMPIRPILPPPNGMPPYTTPTGYRCDEPGCTAVPFQTQYLLSSHKNVHSQNRPHYCPVQECPRSEGGKGFKRKNEMIRHGLVHNSPGYICPFCPDREHRYPRPDNLQRHVRVHHVDKDRDDETLREVLAQRNEGAGKARRRRTHGSIGSIGGS